MFKKTLSAALIFSLLVLPVSSVTPAGAPEASAMAQSYLPGDVPAETDAAESMSPALHALVLAMLNHDVGRFDFADASLTWEGPVRRCRRLPYLGGAVQHALPLRPDGQPQRIGGR